MKKNILANLVGRFWGLLSGFLFIPLYIKYLGFESYSIISFTLILGGIVSILDSGLTLTITREFARSDISFHHKLKAFKTLEAVYLLIILIIITSLFFTSNFIVKNWINIKDHKIEEIATVIKIVSFDLGLQLIFRFYLGGLFGLEKQVKANLYQIGWGIMHNGIVVFIIFFNPSLLVFFYWQSISTLISVILIKVYLEKCLGNHKIYNFKEFIDFNFIKKIWRFSSGMMLIGVVAVANTQMDKLTISKLLSIEKLGYYTIGLSLAQALIMIVNPVATAVLPRFTALYSSNNKKSASELFTEINLVVSIIVFSLMMNLSFFSKEIVYIWTNNMSISINVYQLVPILCLGYAMLALQIIPYQIAIANGYTKLNNYLGVVSLLITIPGYFFAIKIYDSIGAAYIFTLIQILTTFLYVYFITKKFLDVKSPFNLIIKDILIPLIVSFFVCFIFSIIPIEKLNYNRFINLIFVFISTFTTLVATALILVPKQKLRMLLKLKP